MHVFADSSGGYRQRFSLLLISLCAVFGCVLGDSDSAPYDLSRLASRLSKRQSTPGIQLLPIGSLTESALSPECQQAVYRNISCDNIVSTLGDPVYHGPLGDAALTKMVCGKTCGDSLAAAHRSIAAACARTPDIVPGVPVLALIESIQTGWNETCLKDASTSEYCNDIIHSWPPVEDISKMPRNQLCSFCYGAKLRLMKQSPYSAYDELHAATLEYIIKTCNQPKAPAERPTYPIHVNGTRPKACSPDKTYVTRAGDSCDSIATAHKVSSSTLYHTNPNLRDCGNPDEGISLCLPEACEIYSVQPNASCVTLAVDQGVSWMNIVDWNAGIDSRCSNIVGAKPSWGSTICVSPPGGRFSGNPGNSTVSGNGNTGGQGGSGDGYAENLVKVPQGTVAPGTTVECGEYVRAQAGNSCSRMVSQAAVPMDLFIQANPSLESAISCTSKLQVGTWYCLRPWRNWNSKKSA